MVGVGHNGMPSINEIKDQQGDLPDTWQYLTIREALQCSSRYSHMLIRFFCGNRMTG
jgi:hypothetical protein